jgi:hypothetical protein
VNVGRIWPILSAEKQAELVWLKQFSAPDADNNVALIWEATVGR